MPYFDGASTPSSSAPGDRSTSTTEVNFTPMALVTDTSRQPAPPGENIVYWRLPDSEGGQVIVSNSWDTMYGNDLSSHLSGF